MAGETFAYFLTEDPTTTALPLPPVSTDRIPVVRGDVPSEATFYMSPIDIPATQTVPVIVTPASGDTVTLAVAGPVFVNAAALASLTILLPPGPVIGWNSDISFLAPVTTLTILDAASAPVATAPTSAFGPGAALEFKYLDALGWVYWK